MNRENLDVGSSIGPYELLELIGEGWMSAVYRVENAVSGQVCALKLMRGEYAGDASFRDGFARAGANPAGVANDHLVEVLDSGAHAGSLYLVMRYINATDLRRVLASEGRLDPARAVRILSQVAEALDAIHAAGKPYRAVKPGNILLEVGRSDWAYLTDFGLTRNPTRETVGLTSSGTFVGTIAYTAPEQILAEPLGPAVDVYALGCVLFELLTGEPPFRGSREVEVLQAHIYAAPPTVSSAGGPAELDPLIAAVLAKEPGDRPQTCGEMMRAATDALGAVPALGEANTVQTRGVVVAPAAPEPRHATLRVLEGPGQGAELTVSEGEEVRIGRAAQPPADLGGDGQLSRVHARVFIADDGVAVEDLGSTNGTLVGEERVTDVRLLQLGDRLSMGSSVLEVVAAPEAAGEAPSPPAMFENLEPPPTETHHPEPAPDEPVQAESPPADQVESPPSEEWDDWSPSESEATEQTGAEAQESAFEPEPSPRRISIVLDLDLAGGDTQLRVEPGTGVLVSRQADGSWRVELT